MNSARTGWSRPGRRQDAQFPFSAGRRLDTSGPAVVRAVNARRKSGRGPGRLRHGNVSLTVMAAPGALLLFVFAYLPMVGIVIAFKDYRFDAGIRAPPAS